IVVFHVTGVQTCALPILFLSAFSYSGIDRSLERIRSASPMIDVRGVFNSCEALLIKFFWVSKEVSILFNISLNVYLSSLMGYLCFMVDTSNRRCKFSDPILFTSLMMDFTGRINVRSTK